MIASVPHIEFGKSNQMKAHKHKTIPLQPTLIADEQPNRTQAFGYQSTIRLVTFLLLGGAHNKSYYSLSQFVVGTVRTSREAVHSLFPLLNTPISILLSLTLIPHPGKTIIIM